MARTLGTALDTVDLRTLIEYANRMGNKSLGSRLGYLLETFDRLADGLVHLISPIKLDPSGPPTGQPVARWQIVVNIPEHEWVDRMGVG